MLRAAQLPVPSTSSGVADRLCGGCKRTVESESGGVVVAFGSALWHVECFKCAKCGNRVTADTNLLLLSDGSPVCTSCSYNCNVCKKPILDEAIMTGDESYHAACFTCRVCSRRIDELVFAKTSAGIYCMACHNDRVARSRRHAEEKKKRAKNSAARKDPKSPKEQLPVNTEPVSQPPESPQITPATSASQSAPTLSGRLSPSPHTAHELPTSSSTTPLPPLQRANSSPQVQSISTDRPRSNSTDDGARLLAPSASLGVPTSRQERRRSMLAGAPLATPPSSSTQQGYSTSSLPWASDDNRELPARLSSNGQVPSNQVTTLHTSSPYNLPTRSHTLPDHPKPLNHVATAFREESQLDSMTQPPALPSKDITVSSESDGMSLSILDDDVNPDDTVIAPELPQLRFSINEANFLEMLMADDKDEPKSHIDGDSFRSTSPLDASAPLSSDTVTPSARPVPSAIILDDYDATTYQPRADSPYGDGVASFRSSLEDSRSDSLDHSLGHSSTDGTLDTTLEDGRSSRTSVDTGESMHIRRSQTDSLLTVGRSAVTNSDIVLQRLKDALADSNDRNVPYVKLDTKFVETILASLQEQRHSWSSMKTKLDGMRRASQQVIDGLSVAQSEYDRELAARREAQAEVQRLRVQLSGQTARLTQVYADDKRRELMEMLAKDLNENLHGLERDVSKLKAERDLAVAEMEELAASKSAGLDTTESSLSRSLTMRLENIKSEYRRELEPIAQHREQLHREIAELKQTRDLFLEEVTVLNARNEELAELNSRIERQREQAVRSPERPPKPPSKHNIISSPSLSSSAPSYNSSQSFDESREEAKFVKVTKADYVEATPAARAKFRLFKGGAGRDARSADLPAVPEKDRSGPRNAFEHTFAQISVLRVARCDHCGDKMWGYQSRCSNCSISVHTRCAHIVQTSCKPPLYQTSDDSGFDVGPPQPSLFGRDLVEQVHADAHGQERCVPVIVEKCINAVEKSAMDYEGIYRKSGGSGATKSITQLFERGNYDSFDLEDPEVFSDISSITSVLKSYFRALPNPLMTFALHEQFIAGSAIKDQEKKMQVIAQLVQQLPVEHFYTLKYLMLHLHRVQCGQEENLMSARNLGVVFGPTLMRSSDTGREFADMAGKAMTVEWLIENANVVFADP